MTPVVRCLCLALCACLPGPVNAGAQDAPREQRISTGELREQVRRRPQGVVVPVEITKQGGRVVLQTADSAVNVSNAGAVAQQVRQVPIQAAVGAGPGDSVELQNVQLQATKRWNDLAPTQRAKYRRVDAAQRRMSNIAVTALGANATEAGATGPLCAPGTPGTPGAVFTMPKPGFGCASSRSNCPITPSARWRARVKGVVPAAKAMGMPYCVYPYPPAAPRWGG